MPQIPPTMRAVVLKEYRGPHAVDVEERPTPRPGRGQVLVRVAASPINPSDLAFLDGMYGVKKRLPIVPGFEASGVVVAAGGGIWARALVGRRAACAASNQGDGAWAEYMATDALSCVPLLPHISTAQGSMLLVNPLTAWALVDIVRRSGGRALVQTAAASALGRMILRLAQRFDLEVIHIVRRREQAELLRSLGARHVLDSGEAGFDARLRDLSRELGARHAFDAVGGELTGRLLRAMPRGAKVTVYGGLAGAAVQIDPGSLIFRDQRADGFWLATWLGYQNPALLLRAAYDIQRLIGGDLRTPVRACLPLEDARRGLELYAGRMTEGKVLFVPGLRR